MLRIYASVTLAKKSEKFRALSSYKILKLI